MSNSKESKQKCFAKLYKRGYDMRLSFWVIKLDEHLLYVISYYIFNFFDSSHYIFITLLKKSFKNDKNLRW